MALRPVTDPQDPMVGRILDAARDLLRQFGLRRTTVEDIARRADVSRITVYRRFPRKDDLVHAVFVREAEELFDAVDAAVAHLPDAADQLVEGFVTILTAMREDSLVRGLLAVEPEAVLPYVTLDGGPLLALAREYLAARVRAGQHAGQVRRADPEAVAELCVRLTVSFLLTPDSCIPLESPAQMRAFARSYLLPSVAA